MFSPGRQPFKLFNIMIERDRTLIDIYFLAFRGLLLFKVAEVLQHCRQSPPIVPERSKRLLAQSIDAYGSHRLAHQWIDGAGSQSSMCCCCGSCLCTSQSSNVKHAISLNQHLSQKSASGCNSKEFDQKCFNTHFDPILQCDPCIHITSADYKKRRSSHFI